MSIIEKLSIRGIRSFGIKAEDEQVVYFSSPLTLILGENGCGKTTIIECLKYALTGDMPPGSNRGQSFIHDPKIFHTSECLGQVKLLVKNIRGEQLTVTRSMKISQKKEKLIFVTLDGTLHYEANGKKTTISKRCADVNSDMTQFMGVSAAIINNVIFCHQEDSSWPLDEGKKLKEKFDAIFGTIEYNKAIEKIIKLRKTQLDQLKMKEANLKFLHHLKKETDDKSLDLQKAQEKLCQLQGQRLKYEDAMKPIQDRLSKIYVIEMEIGKLQGQKIKLCSELENCQQQMKNLSTKIKNPFEGNIYSLETEIQTFKEKMNDKNFELRNLIQQLQLIKNSEQKIQLKLTDYDRKRTSLILQRQQEQEYLSERANLLTELCQVFKIDVEDDLELSNENIERAYDLVKICFKNEERKIQVIGKEHEEIDQNIQKQIDKLREMKASIESEIVVKMAQKIKLEEECHKNQTQINDVETSASQLQSVSKEIENITKTYEDYSKCIDLEGMKKDAYEKKKNIKTMQEELDRLDEKLTFLNATSKLAAEIDLKEKELKKKESEIKRVKNKHSINLKQLFKGRKIENNFKRNLQTTLEVLQKQLNELNININANKIKEKELQIMRKNKKDELTNFEKVLTEYEEKIFEKCAGNSYREILAKTKEDIAKIQLDYGALKSSNSMYKKYMQKIKLDPCCPVCHKDMNSNEVADLSNELSEEIENLPEKIEKVETELKREQLQYEHLLKLQPIIEKVEQLQNDLPMCKKKLKEIEEELTKTISEVETYQILTAEPTEELNLANSMLSDMTLLDEAIKDGLRLEEELTLLKAQLPTKTFTSSLEDLQTAKSNIAVKLKAERSEIEVHQEKYEKESEILTKLREKRNNLRDKQIKLQEGIQALDQLKARRDEISESINTIALEMAKLRNQLQPLKNELQNKVDEKEKLKEDNKNSLNKLSENFDSLKRKDSDVLRYTHELSNLAELNLSAEIKSLKQLIKQYLDDQKAKANENSTISKKIEQLKSDISNQELLERELHDNREFKLLEQNQNKLKEQYNDLLKDIGELDYKNISKEKTELVSKSDNITIKKSEILGQMGEINNQINSLEVELKQSKYKESLKNYRLQFYEVEVMKKIIADLGQHRIAVEWALMKYHSEKMEKINRLIREYWRQIYRGNDIDYIQIQTDEMKSAGVDKKRSYNYRVVQSKNNTEIDMRGRCSAGQRVLASLIIRMALAETFSSNCGILALDEPTANLDRTNILSLCEALNTIVEERYNQTNFMLIIITHDEDFISTLGRIRNYHKVCRDHEGKSVVRKVFIM